MNSMNDLIRSHSMYDDSYRPAPQVEPQAQYYQAPPPPQPEPVAVQSHLPERTNYSHPYTRPTQTHSAMQDRKTIHAMMQEIAYMQHRLDMLMSSCETMMERTYVSHEYHHIARFHGQFDPNRAQQQPQYQQPTPQSHTQPQQVVHEQVAPPTPQPTSMTKEGVFDGVHMISAEGDMYVLESSFICKHNLIEGDILSACVYSTGKIDYTLSEPTSREHIMGILSTHAAGAEHYIVQTASKAYKVLTEAVETSGATPGKQVLLTVPAGGESEWAAIEQVFT